MGHEADLEDGHSKLDESGISHTKQVIQGPTQRFLSGPAKEHRTGLPVFFYVALWIFLSCSITLLNKRLLDMRFAYPCFLTTLHLAFTSIMTRVLLRFGSLKMDTSLFPPNNTLYFRHIFLMALLFSLALVSGNKAYLYLSVPSIQLLKTLNPIVLLAASWVFRMKAPNAKTLAFSALIVVGSLFACYGSADYNMLGVTYMGVAIITHTVRLMMTQQLINTSVERDVTAVMTLQYFAPLGAIMLGVLAALIEGPELRLASFDLVGIFQLTVNATLAFLLNLSTFHLIGITSSFTLCICAVVRDVVLIAASTLLRRNPLTVFQGLGYSLVFAGVICGGLKKA